MVSRSPTERDCALPAQDTSLSIHHETFVTPMYDGPLGELHPYRGAAINGLMGTH